MGNFLHEQSVVLDMVPDLTGKAKVDDGGIEVDPSLSSLDRLDSN